MSRQFKPGDRVRVGPVKSDPNKEGETYVQAGAVGSVIDPEEIDGQIEVKFEDVSYLPHGIRGGWLVDDKPVKPAAPLPDGGPAFHSITVREGDNYNAPTKYYHKGMSLRQYAAIKLCVPESGTPWLDEMIHKSLKDRFAGQALAGLLANCGGPVQANGMSGTGYCNGTRESTAEWAFDLATAMMERRAEK